MISSRRLVSAVGVHLSPLGRSLPGLAVAAVLVGQPAVATPGAGLGGRIDAAQPARVAHDVGLGMDFRSPPDAAAAVAAIAAPTVGARTGSAIDVLAPGIQYDDAMAHARDAIAFVPGGRVDVPFRPRPGDGWSVASGRPAPLPAGRATGRQMAASRQGTAWTAVAGSPPPIRSSAATSSRVDAPIDAPSLAARPAITATAAAYVVPSTTEQAAQAGPAGLRRQVFGFLPYWELGQSSTVIKYSVLSTIAYFAVAADAAGNLQKQDSSGKPTVGWAGWTSAALTSVINTAHTYGTRVVLTVEMFGWTSGQAAAQLSFLTSPSAQQNLAGQIAAAVRDRGADGVNLDFEPIVQGGAAGFVSFVQLLRAQLDAVSPGYELTVDTTGSPGNYDLERLTAPGAADALFIMGYDYRNDGAPVAGSVSPLGGPNYDLTETVQAYVGRIPASKVILGLPYYGRAWSTTSNAPNAKNQSGAQFGYSAAVTYDQAVDLAAQYGRNWDSIEQSPWFAYQRQNCTTTYGCVTSWREVYYDDAQSLGAKYDLVNRYALRGAGIWTLGYDGTHPELYQALADHFLDDKVAPRAGIVDLAPVQTDEGFAVTWTGWDDWSGVASYDVQASVDGGPWSDWQRATARTSGIYFGSTGHAYAFRVRATDGKGNQGAWSAAPTLLPGSATPTALTPGGFGRVVAASLNLRSAPSTSASRIATAPSNAVVAVLAGPVQAGGYSWYQVSVPVTEWPPVADIQTGVWVATATSDGASTFVAPIAAPNTTIVSAVISSVSFGDAGPGSIGPAAAATRSFSPNGDGSQDALTLHWTNSIGLDSLTLRAYGSDGSPLGQVPVPAMSPGPQSFGWTGSVGGSPLPDGTYMLQLVGTAGATTCAWPSVAPVSPDEVAQDAVTIDTVPPAVLSAAAGPTSFSPNGDGVADGLNASIAVAGQVRWGFSAAPLVIDAGGNATVGPALRRVSGTGPKGSLTWDGKADDGTAAPDGRYRLTLSGFDAAGNPGSRTFDVTIDRRIPTVTLTVTPPTFSPNGDGIADTALLAWTADAPVSGTIGVYSGTRVVRRWTISASAGSTITWDGRTAAGLAAADGRYSVRLDVHDNAMTPAKQSATLTVDRTAGSLKWSTGLFHPQDGDTLARTSQVSFRLTRSASTRLTVVDGAGTVMRTAWSGRTQAAGTWTWTWDGRTGAGAYVPAGTYTARLEVTTSLGTTVLLRSVIAAPFVVTPAISTFAAGKPVTLTIRSAEPLLAAPVVSLVVTGAATPVTVKATPVGTLLYRVTIAVPAAPGPATLTIKGTDSLRKVNTGTFAATIQ